MATYSKYQDMVEQLCRGVHNFGSHTFKVALSNAAPDATHTMLSQITELSTANGYTAGVKPAKIPKRADPDEEEDEIALLLELLS